MRYMKKTIKNTLLVSLIATIGITGFTSTNIAYAKDQSKNLSGEIYELGEKDAYVFSDENSINSNTDRFVISGNIYKTETKDGFTSFAVDVNDNDDEDGKDDNLVITLNNSSSAPAYSKEIEVETAWHIVEDSSKKVNGTILDEKIKTGAIIVQTSKDGKIWVNAVEKTDIFNDVLTSDDPIYKTTNVELSNGCYYRILVAYKMRMMTGTSWWGKVNDYDYKECLEVYEFHAYNKNVDSSELLDISNAYEFGEVYRTAEFEGYAGTQDIDNEDPHNGWDLGHFYVNGYTAKTEDTNGDVIFLKEVGDRTTLWFNLEQDLNACNGNSAIKVTADEAGSDQYFRTPTMNFGKGALIIRKIDYQNKKETQYYTNFLEASATAGANTRVDLFEEGDYEIALDYQLDYDKSKIPGKKTLHYRIYFKFKVRNGDCKLFIRDAENNSFLTNANVAENGFYIDLAQSKYLQLTVTRDVMTDSLDGLVRDTKFNGAAKEGRIYDEEGIYTIKATNKYTEADPTEKKIYVGDSLVLKAYMKNPGLTISEINEKVASGASIDEDGNIIEPEIVEPEETEERIEDEEAVTEDSSDEMVAKDTIVDEPIVSDDENSEETEVSSDVQDEETTYNSFGSVRVIVVVAVILVLGSWVGATYLKKPKKIEIENNSENIAEEKEDDSE